MSHRSDLEAGSGGDQPGPSCGSVGWDLGLESTWHSSFSCAVTRTCDGRRRSTVSDSGDTGIGTYCSDSVEDDCSACTTVSSLPLSQHNLNQEEDSIPSAPDNLSSPSSSPRIHLKIPSSSHSPGHCNRFCQINSQASSSFEVLSGLDMKGHQPIRRSSSFTKLSSGADKSSMKTSSFSYSSSTQGSLDRGVLHGYRKKRMDSNINLYLPLSFNMTYNSFMQRSPGANSRNRYKNSSRSTGLKTDLSPSSCHSSPVKCNLNYYNPHEAKASGDIREVSGLPSSDWVDWPAGQNSDRGTPIQPAVRTQMWLTEQMEYRPKLENGSEPGQISPLETDYGVNDLSSLHQESGCNQMLIGTSIPVNTLLKVKEKLLRERELEIQSQKQQILQLQLWIGENEQRAQQVLDSSRGQFQASIIPNNKGSAMRTSSKPSSDRLCCDNELSEKLTVAELKVLHLNRFFKQITLKYTEEIGKLEEKIKTRDRYISSLKKKSQRASEQSQDKQQRIETLEKYVSDLPTINEVQVQRKQQKLEEKNRHLENTVFQFQKSVEEGCSLIKKKDVMIEMQAKTENELVASVQSLREKVQQCLDDRVRLAVKDLKNLEGENSELLQQQDYSSMVLKMQKDEIDRLTSQLLAKRARLLKKTGPGHRQVESSLQKEDNLASLLGVFSQDKGKLVCTSSKGRMSEVDELLKEMSLCLLDLRGFCSILAQRAQGKEPNLSLLLGMKSLSLPADEQEHQVAEGEEELSSKLLKVALLKRGTDELRRTIAEFCPQYSGESCATQ